MKPHVYTDLNGTVVHYPRPHDRPARRGRSSASPGVLLGTALLVVVLTACGTSDDGGSGGDETTSPSPSSPSGETTGAPASTVTPSTGTPTTRPASTATEPPDATDAPSVITEEDGGAVYLLAVGSSTSLRLTDSATWDEPSVDGDAVELVPVDYLVDPGYAEWSVEARRPGESVIEIAPSCNDGTECATVTFTLVVNN